MIRSIIENNKFLPFFILITLAIIWGSSFILIKKGLDSFSPDQVGTIRITFAFLVMLPIALKNLKPVFQYYWKKLILFGTIANLIPSILFAIAETGLSSSVTGILNSLTPIFTLLVGTLFFSSVIKKGQVGGLIIGFAGSAILTFVGSSGELGGFNYFALFVVTATICYGFSSNMVNRYFMEINSVALTSLAMFSVGPIGLAYLLTTDFTSRLVHIDGAWLSLGYLFILGAIGTAFALILFNRLIQITSPVFASIVTYLIPIAAVFWGIVDGEIFNLMHLGGMVLIVLGVYIINKYN
jgi:drug/metabolite transporter (DMT)-like permease